MSISEHEPRKGTETHKMRRDTLWVHGFQNTNPERGRKLALARLFVLAFGAISEHEPRKGTETKSNLSYHRRTASLLHFRTRTPKGDGNGKIKVITMPPIRRISEHEPRKGTETCDAATGVATEIISEHEPRKGTETYQDFGMIPTF